MSVRGNAFIDAKYISMQHQVDFVASVHVKLIQEMLCVGAASALRPQRRQIFPPLNSDLNQEQNKRIKQISLISREKLKLRTLDGIAFVFVLYSVAFI